MKKLFICVIVLLQVSLLTSAALGKGGEITITDSKHEEEFNRLRGDNTNPPEEVDWQLVVGGGPSTRYMCDDCGFFTASVCSADGKFLSSGSHKPWFKPTCLVDYYGSRGAEMCQFCMKVQWLYDGDHLCWEYHDSCSRGWYDVCPMEVS